MYKSVDIVSEHAETLHKSSESLHNLYGVHYGILIDMTRCQNNGLNWYQSDGLVIMLNDTLSSVYALYRYRCGYGCKYGICSG